MKSGALVFLAAFLALSASWGGFVLAPQLQLGRGDQEKAVPSEDKYPLARPGLAKQGAEVYRSLGCVYCHSQQVGQEQTICEVVLNDAGTNALATLSVLAKLNAAFANRDSRTVLAALPKAVLQVPTTADAEPAVKDFEMVGAKAGVRVSQHGPDIERNWGRRATVAQDYLYDHPVQPGTRRIGPDLANVGLRQPDANWHFRHLYAPQNEVKGSTMPAYRFLFETRRMAGPPSPEALQFGGELASKPGYEIVPKEEARALVAYLLSLRADAPLFEAPFTAPAPVAPPATNSPAK